jgi:hypothetical protein
MSTFALKRDGSYLGRIYGTPVWCNSSGYEPKIVEFVPLVLGLQRPFSFHVFGDKFTITQNVYRRE